MMLVVFQSELPRRPFLVSWVVFSYYFILVAKFYSEKLKTIKQIEAKKEKIGTTL